MGSKQVLDCIVAGDVNVDLLLEGVIELEAGTEKLATRMDLVLGGSSGITAFNLAKLGTKVGIVSVIGKDSFGRICRRPADCSGSRYRGSAPPPDREDRYYDLA